MKNVWTITYASGWFTASCPGGGCTQADDWHDLYLNIMEVEDLLEGETLCTVFDKTFKMLDETDILLDNMWLDKEDIQ